MEDLIKACNDALYDFTGSDIYANPLKPGVSRRQIFEDIRYMESNAGYQIPLDRIKDGKRTFYRYSTKDFSIDNQPITNEEMAQLREMSFLLNRFKGLPQCEWMNELVTNLEDKFHLKGSSKSVIFLESSVYNKGVEHISPLFNAIINKQTLHITYTPFGKSDCEWDIHPYYIKQYNNRWFLIGLNNKDFKISNLGLDRIITFTISPIPYIEDNIVEDVDEYFADVVGVTIPRDTDIEHVILKFSSNRFPYIESKPLHESMKFVDKENGIISIDVIPNKELTALILSFGSDVEVIEPKPLRDNISSAIEQTFKKYFTVQNDCTHTS